MGRRFRQTGKGTRRRAMLVATVALISAVAAGTTLTNRGGAEAATESQASETPIAEATCPAGKAPIELAVPLEADSSTMCLPISADSSTGSRVDPLYSRVATGAIDFAADHIDGTEAREAIVVCWSPEDWTHLTGLYRELGANELSGTFGFVSPPHNVINLSPDVCRDLDRVAHDGSRPASMIVAKAIGTVAHEALHVAGVHDEGAAECYAIQLTPRTAIELGTDGAFAEKQQKLSWQFNSARVDGSHYASGDCHAGSSLDLGLGGTIWA